MPTQPQAGRNTAAQHTLERAVTDQKQLPPRPVHLFKRREQRVQAFLLDQPAHVAEHDAVRGEAHDGATRGAPCWLRMVDGRIHGTRQHLRWSGVVLGPELAERSLGRWKCEVRVVEHPAFQGAAQRRRAAGNILRRGKADRPMAGQLVGKVDLRRGQAVGLLLQIDHVRRDLPQKAHPPTAVEMPLQAAGRNDVDMADVGPQTRPALGHIDWPELGIPAQGQCQRHSPPRLLFQFGVEALLVDRTKPMADDEEFHTIRIIEGPEDDLAPRLLRAEPVTDPP